MTAPHRDPSSLIPDACLPGLAATGWVFTVYDEAGQMLTARAVVPSELGPTPEALIDAMVDADLATPGMAFVAVYDGDTGRLALILPVDLDTWAVVCRDPDQLADTLAGMATVCESVDVVVRHHGDPDPDDVPVRDSHGRPNTATWSAHG